MRLRKIEEVEDFITAVNACKHDVYLISDEGDKLNLKSTLTQYVAIGALLGKEADRFELFCDDRADEQRFLKFFYEHQETI